MADGVAQPGVTLLRSSVLADISGLAHGFSTRAGGVSRVYRPGLPAGEGDLNLGYTAEDDASHVQENRRRLLASLRAPTLQRFAVMRQIHSAVIHTVEPDTPLPDDFSRPGTLEGDGLITNVPGVLLAIGTADCIPVLLFDPVQRVVAAFHAGWRGTLAGIVERGVAAMALRYGSEPGRLFAAIGPGIGPDSYVVSPELKLQFEAEFGYGSALFREDAAGRLFLNLWEANRRQLLQAGVPAGNIDVLTQDTSTNPDLFFSYRAENGRTGRMLSVIGLTA